MLKGALAPLRHEDPHQQHRKKLTKIFAAQHDQSRAMGCLLSMHEQHH
jgi:hypothetical protein